MTHGLDTSFLVATEVSCHSDHTAARTLASSLRQNGDHFALAPQAVAEFVHIVTDARRFTAPLTIPQALERARIWWDAADVDRLWPDESSVAWVLHRHDQAPTGQKTSVGHVAGGDVSKRKH